METVLLAALIACADGQATCSVNRGGMYSQLYVCDVVPDSVTAKPMTFRARVLGENFLVAIKPKCWEA